ncbi:hypothetical protein AGMMS4952_26000 [Spirochaetia bacterium]|nr:hypothetical protein AGMMS4952_26000 [Spirochaetia bacterium]
MRIGIMTFWTTKGNYGTILQCYALQKYLINIGHDAFLIRYDLHLDEDGRSKKKIPLKYLNPVKIFEYIIRRLWFKFNVSRENRRNFDIFKEKYLKKTENIYSFSDLVNDPPDADVYITGSDQVWNFKDSLIFEKQRRAYLLDFGKKEIKRLAVAVSFGHKRIDKDILLDCASLMRHFNHISVREKSGIDICKEIGIQNVELIVDPVLLLTKEHYFSLYSNNVTISFKRPYCLVYLLKNTINFPFSKIKKYAKKQGLDIIYITANFLYDTHRKYFATIEEWLCLIDNAECVLTNSFHGTVFSLIFQKKFGVFPLSSAFEGWNERFYSLFEQFGIKDGFIKDDTIISLGNDINWDNISKNIEKWRTHTMSILKGNL